MKLEFEISDEVIRNAIVNDILKVEITNFLKRELACNKKVKEIALDIARHKVIDALMDFDALEIKKIAQRKIQQQVENQMKEIFKQ